MSWGWLFLIISLVALIPCVASQYSTAARTLSPRVDICVVSSITDATMNNCVCEGIFFASFFEVESLV